jgi:tetratricopeptide (TPR) repeat protein
VQIHLYLAEILEERKISSNASCSYYDIIAHYSQVILHDKGLIAIYNKLGDLFYKAKDYNKAILCYKVLNDFLHINKCFKAWLTEEEDNPEIWLKRGDYHLSICQTQKAAEYYHNAFGASKDVSSKEIALNKKAKALSPSDETTAEFRAAIQAHNCYNFPSAGDEFSTQILGVENDIHTES